MVIVLAISIYSLPREKTRRDAVSELLAQQKARQETQQTQREAPPTFNSDLMLPRESQKEWVPPKQEGDNADAEEKFVLETISATLKDEELSRLPELEPDTNTGFGSVQLNLVAEESTEVLVEPVYQPPPVVPENQEKEIIRGWVLVSFEINEMGHTENIKVLKSEPEGVFEEAVISAISSWRYNVVSDLDSSEKIEITEKIIF